MNWILWAVALVAAYLIFRFMVRTGKKSVAAVAVQNALEYAQANQPTQMNMATMANAIVASYCDSRPDLFARPFGSTMSPTIVALGALADARRNATDRRLSALLQSALGQIVVRVGKEGLSRRKPMNMNESEVLASSYAIYQDTSLD